MALTKVGKEGVVGLDNSADATAITISSGEVVTLSNNLITNGNVLRGANDSSNTLSGGTASNSGSNIAVYGSSHSSLASNIRFRSGSTVTMLIDSTGAITKPLQPAFLADCNYTGSGLAINTTHTVPALNERFDQNGDYNTSTYTFTAPVTGKYQLNGNFYVHAFDDTSNYVQFFITTSNRTYAGIIDNTLTSADVDNYNNSISVLADMDVNDTAKLQLNIPNSGAAQMAVSNLMNFSGYLVC